MYFSGRLGVQAIYRERELARAVINHGSCMHIYAFEFEFMIMHRSVHTISRSANHVYMTIHTHYVLCPNAVVCPNNTIRLYTFARVIPSLL